jgi:hypothetical protein
MLMGLGYRPVSAAQEKVGPLEFSPELAVYEDQPTARSRTVDEIYDLTNNPNLTLPDGYVEIRKQIIKMHKDMGIDVSIMEKEAFAQRPKTWAMRTPKPLEGEFEMPHSIDSCFYHKIPSDYPRVKLPIGYIETVHIATVGEGGDGWGFGIAISGAHDPIRDVCGNKMHVRDDAWDFAPANNGDKHLIFIDGADKTFLCTWKVRRNGDGYGASYTGGVIPLLTLGDYGGTNAPHISDLAMMIRKGQLTDPARGPLKHGVYGPTTKTWFAVVYPAWRTDGNSMKLSKNNRGLIPYGGIVQLNPAIDLEAYRLDGKPLTLPAKRMLRAIQEYGWYVNDWGVRDMDFHTNATGVEFDPFGGVKGVDREIRAVVNREQLYSVPPLVKKAPSAKAK